MNKYVIQYCVKKTKYDQDYSFFYEAEVVASNRDDAEKELLMFCKENDIDSPEILSTKLIRDKPGVKINTLTYTMKKLKEVNHD